MKEGMIGLDIGGTYIRGGITDRLDNAKNYLHQMKKIPLITYKNIKIEIEKNICTIIDGYIQTYKDITLRGIGISLAASVDRDTGVVVSWPNHKAWVGFNIQKFLNERYRIPIKIEDDANCGALGEYYYEKEYNCNNMLYITLGTGIGCGIIINGNLFIGDSGFAGELGHTSTNNSSVCICGQIGCLQAPKEDYQDRKNHIAQAIYNLVMILDISNIVIGGGASIEYNIFLGDLKELVTKKLKHFNRKIDISPAVNKEGSGVLGALYLFM